MSNDYSTSSFEFFVGKMLRCFSFSFVSFCEIVVRNNFLEFVTERILFTFFTWRLTQKMKKGILNTGEMYIQITDMSGIQIMRSGHTIAVGDVLDGPLDRVLYAMK